MKRIIVLTTLMFLSSVAMAFALSSQHKDILKVLKKAGASQAGLDTLTTLLKTNAPESQIQNRVNLFWNNKIKSLTDEEKVVYGGLADSTERIGYLSCKTKWERFWFLRKLNKNQKEKLWQTEADRIFYFSFKLVASDKELKEYLNLPDSSKEQWLYTFWKKKDPNPTTEENEFKIEFDRRVEYVLYNFWVPFGQQKPWDDRGDVYILYGGPNEKETPTSQYDRSESRSLNIEDLPLVSGKLSERPILSELDRFSAEVWHYFKDDMFFQFEDANQFGIWELNVYGNKEPKEALAEFMQNVAENVGIARVEYKPDFGPVLDFPWNWWKFWNEGDYYNVRINLGIPIEKLGLLSDSSDLESGWLVFQERIVISDSKRKTIASDSVWVRKKVSKYLNRKDLLLVDQYNCDSLTPGFYNIAISIKDSAGNRMGIYQDTSVILVSHVKVKASEKISQLIMSDSVWEADSNYIQRNGTKFVRNGLVIKPRPGNVYLSGQSPSFYCEMYELKKGEDDSSRCKIYYYFLKKNEKTGKFDIFQGPFAEEASYPSNSQPYIKGTLSSDKFPSGEYIIRIDVYDLNDKKAQEDQIRKTVAGFKVG
jgi:GWxTD domain-containing protein